MINYLDFGFLIAAVAEKLVELGIIPIELMFLVKSSNTMNIFVLFYRTKIRPAPQFIFVF